MKAAELFYPDIQVSIGSYTFTGGVRLEVSSGKSSRFDWAKIRFTRQFQDRLIIPSRAAARIQLGYDGRLEDVFTGYVSKPYNGSGQDEIMLKDDMLLLDSTRLSSTFLDATPQEIVGYALAAAGIQSARLSDACYPPKPRFSACEQSISSLINAVQAAWGINEPCFFSGGVFYWGTRPRQDRIYTFEHGVNIIRLDRADGLWELETVSIPSLRHSHVIRVRHPKISGEFEVQKVRFATNGAGFIRTTIYF